MRRSQGRPLTDAEARLATSVFGTAIDYSRVRIHNAKWAFFQPRGTAMAPDGHIWFHPLGRGYCDDFCDREVDDQGLYIHEMTHVWQRQQGVFLPLARHPFCRYDYSLIPGWPLARYGIEQQAEIVRHAFLLRERRVVKGAPGLDVYRSILPFNAL